ncbi:rho coiled-coil associated kinase alpha [Fusarium longipes]|uniref:Rho coiled-coil associated kinase alpha n=1 Tax=Fusarium longipes TaxID=694270 RepID=A0A395T750_9HYPO|nr:rho coiled-coil associated kinase alpha [Fusarium longipes]
MEVDTASRYRSRILREMKANRDNPFNSPPSSTGSHGTVSPTRSSVFSDPDGESTRRLNEDIARVTAPRNLPVNWEAAHRKWPEFFGPPRTREVPVYDDDDDTRPMSAESKENKPPAIKFTVDDTTQHTWQGSARTRSEMQPRVDNESDLSSILSKSPARAHSYQSWNKNTHNPSPLSKVHNRVSSELMAGQKQRRESLSDALDRLRRGAKSPDFDDQEQQKSSPHMSSAKSSLTAVPPSPASIASPAHNESNARSFFMPDISNLGDFVDGTLRFTGSMRNGVPIFVKNGRVHDRLEKPSLETHAEVDEIEVPKDEEEIFVSMDMIRHEIVSLQEHYDKVHEYAENLQQQVERLEAQLKSQKSFGNDYDTNRANEVLLAQKNRLEVEISTLQSRLEQASRKNSLNEIENDSLVQERDRAVRKLQEACEDINKLTRKLNTKQKELETTHKQLESTDQIRGENDTLRRDLMSIKHGRDSLELENKSLSAANETLRKDYEALKEEIESLRSDNNGVRHDHHSLFSENRSLRTSNKALMEENDELRENLDGVQHELDAAKEEIENLQQELQNASQDKSTLGEDNASLVRHNEKYFEENKILRRENSGFERTIHDLHDENVKLKDEVVFLKQQLESYRPVPKEDFSARLDDETEENMTSAFFIPDITMNSNTDNVDTAENAQATETKEITEQTDDSVRLPTIPDVTEEETRTHTKRDSTVHNETRQSQSKSKSSKSGTQQKVAFSIPSKTSKKASSNVANQGSKRRTTSDSKRRSSMKGIATYTYDMDTVEDNDETTGVQSVDNTTQDNDYSTQLDVVPKARKEAKAPEQKQKQSDTQNTTVQSHKSQHSRSHSRSSRKQVATDITANSIKSVDKDTCPVLSSDARRVLDDLCEHECKNCTVCSRITSHRGIFSSADIAAGKKRVTIRRPVPVTDRDLTTEDHTMRPAQHPGHALAVVIKGLEDESHHLQLELTRIQAQYSGRDKALGRRDRLGLAESIRTLLKQLEAKNDQIYSLYDVLEGQKAAGQAMSEEEIELTVLNITGMTVRDATSHSDQLTWEGIPEL